MENCEETNIEPFVDMEEFNCDVINHSSCIGRRNSLVGTVVSCKEDAFKLYNDHAFRGLMFTREIKSPRQDNRNVYLDPRQLIDLKIRFESSDCYVYSLIFSKRWGLLEVANDLKHTRNQGP
ncbi:hypothetical protein M9H77_02167 [Catharanthus roseus]|uniref:Uncharacterized protein n=1 Tax=Catharanthus roseus TaxID=4058 RepID=A0ACC0C7R5_CATRO|nr:hypothetical protein M9H77_02167 [Catharanthus roseus]